MDPSYTETVNAWHTAAGTADIMSHILESYFSNAEGYMQDRMAEGLLKTCIQFGSGRWSIPRIMRPGPISCGLEAGPLTIF